MRLLSIGLLSIALLVVYWLGATDYSQRIERDIAQRTQHAISGHKNNIVDISRKVDGRDVDVFGTATSNIQRIAAFNDVKGIWGVRVAHDRLKLSEPEEQTTAEVFNFFATYQYPKLTMTGLVDESAYETASNIHNALPPESVLDRNGLETGSTDLVNSPRKIETGIAAVTQLNPGTLRITNKQFILEGDVSSEEHEKTIRLLIDTRREELEPLEVIVNINVVSSPMPADCLAQLKNVFSDNVLNYAVDHYRILDEHLPILDTIAYAVLGPCNDYIGNVLVEGHADFTGTDGYNQGLSERRSGTARQYLIDNGIDASRVKAFGYGEFRPIASNETFAGRAKNRRTEIYLLPSEKARFNDSTKQLTTFTED